MKSLLTLLILPIIILSTIFIYRYTACIREYKIERHILRHKIRHAVYKRSKDHWERRLRWERYLLVPFFGRFLRDTALRMYSNRKHKKRKS